MDRLFSFFLFNLLVPQDFPQDFPDRGFGNLIAKFYKLGYLIGRHFLPAKIDDFLLRCGLTRFKNNERFDGLAPVFVGNAYRHGLTDPGMLVGTKKS